MTNSNLEKGIPWRFGPDWPGQRCGAKTRRARPARGRRASATDASPCTVADPQGPRQGMASRGLQRLVRPMASTQRRSGQRPSVLQSRGARCGPSWLSLRLGSWTTVIWTRNGGISSNRGPVIVGSWHWTDCLRGYCGFNGWSSRDTLKGYPLNKGRGPWAMGL